MLSSATDVSDWPLAADRLGFACDRNGAGGTIGLQFPDAHWPEGRLITSEMLLQPVGSLALSGAPPAAAPRLPRAGAAGVRAAGHRPGRARGATERQRAGQDPEHQPGDAERREAHGQRPAEAVAGRTERSEEASEPVRAQPLGVLRPELEVPGSLDRGELAG